MTTRKKECYMQAVFYRGNGRKWWIIVRCHQRPQQILSSLAGGIAASQLSKHRRQRFRDVSMRNAIRRYLSIRCHLVDHMRQKLRKLSRDLFRLQPNRLRDLTDLPLSEDLLQLPRRDRQILAGADPGRYEWAQPTPIERLHQPREPSAPGIAGEHLSNLLNQSGR